MKNYAIILEDNFDKLLLILDKYRAGGRDKFSHNPILCFATEQDALEAIDAIVRSSTEQLKFTLFIDDQLLHGSGRSFLNRAIDNFLGAIHEVILTSYSYNARREMQETCMENLIAVELLPLPFTGGQPD